MIDLRSDTLTKPTQGMMQAMLDAEVGDDVYREDPTVNELEEYVADLLNKESALLVASGTMGNQLAVMAHVVHGQEIIVEAESHIFRNEAGGVAYLSGAQTHPIQGRYGMMAIGDIENAIQQPDIHHPVTGLICLENTHNAHGGVALPMEYLRQVQAVAWMNRLPIHMDGARLFNAALAVDCTPGEIAAMADSVTVCLSKGLGAPIGAVLCGPWEFIEKARRLRKMLGGGMRQAGFLAAAGLYGLKEGCTRLKGDHFTARKLANGLKSIRGIEVDLFSVQSNIVYAMLDKPMDAMRFVAAMEEQGVALLSMDRHRVRMVTHLHITAADIDKVLNAAQQVMRAAGERG